MAEVEDIMRRTLEDCVYDIRRRHVEAGQRVTGRTMDALEARVRREGTTIIGEIWGLPYTGAWETGSRPARRRGSDEERRAMIRHLREWADIRGLTAGMTDSQAQHLASYLAWYIKRYGSRLYREGGRRDIITPAVEAAKATLAERLGAFYDTEINNMFFNGTD